MAGFEALPTGKLSLGLMADLLRFTGWPDERVVLGPRIGEDAAVIDVGDHYLVAKTDPITFATAEIGWYLVQVNANDVAAMGAVPCWLLVTLLLPENKTTPEVARRIFEQIDSACRELHIAVVGGHTEITHSLDRPIAIGQMLGECAKDQLITSGGARVGDDLVLVNGIAIEGTSIIAREKSEELRARGYTEDLIARAQNYLYDPGISVVRAARLAAGCVDVHAMHDPTEGGLATGLHELAEAADVGVWVDQDTIPIWPECAKLCAEFRLDPLGTIASGGLLLALPQEQTPTLLSAYQQAQLSCAVIGHVTPADAGARLKTATRVINLPRYDQDEITKLF